MRNHYSLASTGGLVRWVLLAYQVGGAASTYLYGLIYETAGVYGPAFVLMAIAALFGEALDRG